MILNIFILVATTACFQPIPFRRLSETLSEAERAPLQMPTETRLTPQYTIYYLNRRIKSEGIRVILNIFQEDTPFVPYILKLQPQLPFPVDQRLLDRVALTFSKPHVVRAEFVQLSRDGKIFTEAHDHPSHIESDLRDLRGQMVIIRFRKDWDVPDAPSLLVSFSKVEPSESYNFSPSQLKQVVDDMSDQPFPLWRAEQVSKKLKKRNGVPAFEIRIPKSPEEEAQLDRRIFEYSDTLMTTFQEYFDSDLMMETEYSSNENGNRRVVFTNSQGQSIAFDRPQDAHQPKNAIEFVITREPRGHQMSIPAEKIGQTLFKISEVLIPMPRLKVLSQRLAQENDSKVVLKFQLDEDQRISQLLASKTLITTN